MRRETIYGFFHGGDSEPMSTTRLTAIEGAPKTTLRNPAQDLRDAGIVPAPRNAKEAAADRVWREGVSDETVDAYLTEAEREK